VARVFVSHASKDSVLAGEVHRWLVDAGHEVFLDQDPYDGITADENWEQRLYEVVPSSRSRPGWRESACRSVW
jgi:biotin carboxylase